MSTCDANFNKEIKHAAAKQACNECPFRKSNQDKPHAAGWFDPENVTRLWRSIAHGSSLGCHKFDSPDWTGFDELAALEGYKTPVNIDGRKECAGTTGLIWREIKASADFNTYEEYHAARPYGLQRGAWAVVSQRLKGKALELVEPTEKATDELIDLSEYIDVHSMWWKFSKEQVDNMVSAAFEVAEEFGWDLDRKPCECPVCLNHSDAHEMTTVQLADGEEAQVDKAVAPVLQALAGAGIQTTASCEDLGDAIGKLAPDLRVGVLNPPPSTVNYAEAVSNGKAVVRFRTKSPESVSLIKALRASGRFTLTIAQEESQFTYHLEQQQELLKLIGLLNGEDHK